MPGVIEVSAKAPKVGKEATINYDFGENLDEMISFFGVEVTFSQARSQMKVGCQAAIRRFLEAGKDPNDVATMWKPGVQMERIVDPIASALKKFASMNDEEKAKFLADLEAIG